MTFDVKITCSDGKRDSVMEKIKEFKDVKNIQQRKDKNELLVEIDSNDASYVQNNVVNRMRDIEDLEDATIVT